MRTGFAQRMNAPGERSRSERAEPRRVLNFACAALIGSVLLSSCTVTRSDPTALPSASSNTRSAVSPSRAFDMFESICLQTGPRYAAAERVAANQGISDLASNNGLDGIERYVSPTEIVALELYRQRVESRLQVCKVTFAAPDAQKDKIAAAFEQRFYLDLTSNPVEPAQVGFGIPFGEDFVVSATDSRLPPNLLTLEAQSYHFLSGEES